MSHPRVEGLLALLCVALPSWLLIRTRHYRRYRLSRCLSWPALALSLVECDEVAFFGH